MIYQRLLKQFLLILLFSFPLLLVAQTNDYKGRKCFGYEKDSCPNSANMFYKVHQNSRSALFVKGQTSQTPLTIYNGRDYRISLCWDPILGSQVFFKLIDAQTSNVLYDNATNEYASDFEFTVAQTRDIILEIKVPGSSTLMEAKSNDEIILVQKDTDMGCLGILIEHMITPSKGF